MHISRRAICSLSAIAFIATAFIACEAARSPRNPDRSVTAYQPVYDYPRDGGVGGYGNRRSTEISNRDPGGEPDEPMAGDLPASDGNGGMRGTGGGPGKIGRGGYGSGSGGVGGRMSAE